MQDNILGFPKFGFISVHMQMQIIEKDIILTSSVVLYASRIKVMYSVAFEVVNPWKKAVMSLEPLTTKKIDFVINF